MKYYYDEDVYSKDSSYNELRHVVSLLIGRDKIISKQGNYIFDDADLVIDYEVGEWIKNNNIIVEYELLEWFGINLHFKTKEDAMNFKLIWS